MGMGSTLGVVAKDVPKRPDDSVVRDGTTAPTPLHGPQLDDGGALESWTIRDDPPARIDPPNDSRFEPPSALTDAEISRRRRQRIVLTGVCLFAAVIFSLAALRALFR